MARTQARSGFGMIVRKGDSGSPEAFTALPEVTDVNSVGGITIDSIEVTHLNSDNQTKEYIPGLKDHDEIQVTMNWLAGNATQNGLLTDAKARTVRNWQITVAGSGNRVEGAAFITKITPTSPKDGAMQRVMSLRPTGAWSEVADT